MSIQQLPEDVVAQIKSSTTITSLNGVACGLLKNSLDAGATRVNVSVDYAKGNCSVEDNGSGIVPQEFAPSGGLGKLHSHPDFHGSSGTFLASVAALSLMSITSHHKGHHSHNSIRIHNSQVLARHTPAPPEQRLLSFSHGTRTTVRNLFGSMPVRVKQRAAVVDKAANAKDWEHLKTSVVALLLPWPGQVTISIRDSATSQTAVLKNSEAITQSLAERARRSLLISRISSAVYQAGLSEEADPTSWVTLKASSGQLSITGVVSIVPVATKRIQFISVGIQPLSNERGSNVLYEEINRLFANSSFGLGGKTSNMSEEEQVRRAEDRHRTEGYTDRELKARKGVDKWPMFHIQVDLGKLAAQTAAIDLEEVLDERRNRLQTIMDVLRAMIYEFLKKHHFRPIHYKPKRRRSPKRSESQRSASRSHSRGTTPALTLRPASQENATSNDVTRPSVGDLATSSLRSKYNREQRSSYESPFDGWSRIKSGRQTLASTKAVDDQSQGTSIAAQKYPLNIPLFNPEGDIVRLPFQEVADPPETCHQGDVQHKDRMDRKSSEQASNGEEDIVWINPMTKQKSSVDARTGFVLATRTGTEKRCLSGSKPSRLTSAKQPRNQPLSQQEEASPWIGELLLTWKNPVFEATEQRVPVAFGETKLISMDGCPRKPHSCHREFPDTSFGVAGRISKAALRAAEVIAQVDRKFIFAKVPLGSALDEAPERQNRMSLLIVIDQHAADERCRLERLLKEYFGAEESGKDEPGQARSEVLDKILQFEISAQERVLFERHLSHFAHWGIGYQLNTVPPSIQQRKLKFPSFLKIMSLPPSIAERCRTEPRLLIDLLRKEVWKLDEVGGRRLKQASTTTSAGAVIDDSRTLHWLSRLHDCPRGILDLINSRACRSAIMFNDMLSPDECKSLLTRLADCAFPFQCAHGRPSMVPLIDMGDQRIIGNERRGDGVSFGKHFKKWKENMSEASF
ncbi:vacuolar membrane protein [Seiridium cupressi]